MDSLDKRLRALTPAVLKGLLRGVEKEGLRANGDGTLALTSHPAGLGSALTHPHITTDFSESQLELITGVHVDDGSCIAELTEIHQAVVHAIGDELLWGTSMPCRLPARDDDIPLGQYGRSNIGTAKTVYRQGLSYRYGRRMQTISGVHYNFSLPEAAWPLLQQVDGKSGPVRAYQDDSYFALTRNFRRDSWLLMYLFGASPAVCATFADGREHALQALRPGTLYLPHATSLRMGPLGYQSEAQSNLAVSYNCLESYARSLHRALTEPYPEYASIGIRDGAGYRQLSDTLLQIENEFYGTIRPKRRINPGERPLHALADRGVEYVEVRCMDIDPFSAVGITAEAMKFLDVFLLHCLLADSPDDSPEAIAELSENRHLVADRGREPGLRLMRSGREITLAAWGGELLRACEPIADALDAAHGGHNYRDAVVAAAAAVRDSSLTPSARVLREMEALHEKSHLRFALAQSAGNRKALLNLHWSDAVAARYEQVAEASRAEQREIEAADTEPFEVFRRRYVSEDLLRMVSEQSELLARACGTAAR